MKPGYRTPISLRPTMTATPLMSTAATPPKTALKLDDMDIRDDPEAFKKM
jgi:hypothetical protein